MELIYFFRIIFKRKWIILAAGLAGVVAAFLLTMNKKPLFKSQAQMSTGFTISEEIKLSDDIFNIPQIDVKFNNVIENINSPKVLNLLSYKLLLHDFGNESAFIVPDKSKWEKNELLKGVNTDSVRKILNEKYSSMQMLRSGIKAEKQLQELLKEYGYDLDNMRKFLHVSRFQRTDYINILYHSVNPELSAFVVNNLITEFHRYYEAFRRERSLESMVAMDSLVVKRKAELDEKIRAKSQYLDDSVVSTMDPNLVGANKLSQISMYESSLAEEISRVQNLSYQMEQIDLQLKSLGEAPAPVTNNADNQEYFRLRKEYNDLYDKYIKQGATDQEMKLRLDDLQRRLKLSAPTGGITTDNSGYNNSQRNSLMQTKIDLEGRLRSANSKITFYRGKLAEAGSFISAASPDKSGRLVQLDKEIEVAMLEYTSAKERLTLASSINETGVSNFKQTLYGQPALKAEPSKRLIIMALAGFSGIVISALVFIFLAYIDQSIKTPQQFQRLTGLPLIGTINVVNLKATRIKEQVTQVEENSDNNRHNTFRELLRKLRYEIESSGKRVILFTSTEPQQGKTTLIQALAFSLSLSKKKVLLLDTNFCNNDLTVYNDAKPTLEKYSAEGHDVKATEITDLITNTGVENVDIIGCQGGDYTPTEILPKDHLLNHLKTFLQQYDFILMEGAPLNGFTDTKELSQYADGILAIFSATAEIKPADKDSIKYFKTVKSKFLGAVLNKVDNNDINL